MRRGTNQQWFPWAVCAAFCAGAAGCVAGSQGSSKGSAKPADAAEHPAPATTDASRPRETCNNGIDDTGEGAVDEGCACTPGETQKCWAPGASAECAAVQQCDGSSGSESYTWGPCSLNTECEAACRTDEMGLPICTDQRCAGRDECVHPTPMLCPEGGNPVLIPDTGLVDAGKRVRIVANDTPRFHVLCVDASTCAPNEIMLADGPKADTAEFNKLNGKRCIAKPDCPAGQVIDFPATATGNQVKLICSPCAMVIEYSKCAVAHHERICAPRPNVQCSADQLPTFRAETRTWECRGVSNCGDAIQIGDEVIQGGAHVCVPCS